MYSTNVYEMESELHWLADLRFSEIGCLSAQKKRLLISKLMCALSIDCDMLNLSRVNINDRQSSNNCERSSK